MDYYKYLVKKLEEVVSKNDCEFILYPFGYLGALAKGILNGLYAVQEKAIIDNILCNKYSHIESLNYLNQIELDGCKILITSDNVNCYEELREKLYTMIQKEQCIELFPVPTVIEEYSKIKPKIIKKMADENISKEKPIYHPKKAKSVFYLPLLPTDYIQYTILLTDDYYERNTLEKVFTSYKKGIIRKIVSEGTVLDIGANIGNHTLYFCNECDAKKVYCFEPAEQTFSILEKNVSLNHLEQKVELLQMGLGEREERASAGVNIYNIGGTRLKLNESGGVSIKRLDDLGIKEKIVFIKIDVEGMENRVLRGGMELIKKNRPYIMVESFGNKVLEIKELLCEIGYRYENLDLSGNWLFCPNN